MDTAITYQKISFIITKLIILPYPLNPCYPCSIGNPLNPGSDNLCIFAGVRLL
jgi:hypothetical protein